MVAIHVLLGLSLASWSFFIASPFSNRSQLAAVTTTFLACFSVIFALGLPYKSNPISILYSIIFPPASYVYAMKAVCRKELAANGVPVHYWPGPQIEVMLIVAAVGISSP
jgi:ATP-binding cassette, subfamily A (ABC1), member 3